MPEPAEFSRGEGVFDTGVVCEAHRVGVLFSNAWGGFVVQQAVKDIGRVAQADIDHFGMERRILSGDIWGENVRPGLPY